MNPFSDSSEQILEGAYFTIFMTIPTAGALQSKLVSINCNTLEGQILIDNLCKELMFLSQKEAHS